MNSIAVTLLTLMATSSNAMKPGKPALSRRIKRMERTKMSALPVDRQLRQEGPESSGAILPLLSSVGRYTSKGPPISAGGYGRVYRVETVNEDAVIKEFDVNGDEQHNIKECKYERGILEKIASYEAKHLSGKTLQISHIRTDYPTVEPHQLMLEYIPGKDLWRSDFTKYCDSMPKFVDIMMSMMQQISGVFKGLHSAYIYHNDVKHANILFVPSAKSLDDSKFYLIDFGLAFSLSTINDPAFERQELSPWCSLKFMSPYHLQLMNEKYLAKEGKPADLSGKSMREAAKKADHYSLALTAIDCIKRHCDRDSVNKKDPLCKMSRELVMLQNDWRQHAADFINWPLTTLKELLVPFWTEVAQQIANFREQNPGLYPEVMRLLAQWTSCQGFVVCQLIESYGEQIEAKERRWKIDQIEQDFAQTRSSIAGEFIAELQRILQEQERVRSGMETQDVAATNKLLTDPDEIRDLAATRTQPADRESIQDRKMG